MLPLYHRGPHRIVRSRRGLSRTWKVTQSRHRKLGTRLELQADGSGLNRYSQSAFVLAGRDAEHDRGSE
jgi:hypothetical protein